MLAIKIYGKYIPNALETKICLTSHRIAEFNVKNKAIGSDRVISLQRKKVGREALVPRVAGAQPRGKRASLGGTECAVS